MRTATSRAPPMPVVEALVLNEKANVLGRRELSPASGRRSRWPGGSGSFPLARHLWWTAERQLRWNSVVRRRAPILLMFRTILRVHREHVPRVRALLDEPARREKTAGLRSPRQLRRFLDDAPARALRDSS
jgi:hypothetical protein